MKIAVIGAGSWGTAIANLIANNGHNVSLWCRRGEVAHAINTQHKNPDYLKEYELHNDVVATTSLADALANASAAVVVTPSKLARGTARAFSGLVDSSFPIVILSKGVEDVTGMLPVEVFQDELGNPDRLAALCGPTHAEEVVHGVPSATVVASPNLETAQLFCDVFASDVFRVYTSDDVTGVELCAAFKNVIAIAVGISYGLGYGDNTAAMLMTRGLAEMGRLVAKAGGNSMTCLGLAGAGDLIVTCTSQHSRNRRFGERAAQGQTVAQFEAEEHMIAEGALACKTLDTLSKKYQVELPIADAVRSIVWDGVDAREVAKGLVSRPLKPEFYGM
jgi:glycerol-3-phosphate dehydrogenase (NAD(P)+)